MTSTEDHSRLTQREDAHQGHDLESGMLERVREWVDLFPCLRLIRILRLAASPTMLSLTAITFAVWVIGLGLLFELSLSEPARIPFVLIQIRSVWGVIWTILLWSPTAIWLTRQGGLLAAGRDMAGLQAGWRIAFQRSWRGWSTATMPLLAAFLLAAPIYAIGLIARAGESMAAVEWVAGVLAALLAIPSGLLAFGGLIAIPLSWAALGNEQDADPLNALSRGYEAFFRRPIHLAFYLLIALLIGSVIWWIGRGMATAASLAATIYLEWSGCPQNVISTTNLTLTAVPAVMLTTLGWGFVGGIYLLLRYDTGGQEVEDLWEPTGEPSPPLPELPTT
ncbi:MAG: hypothetical protein AAGG48_06500 [Planctomycetota bacterium]